LGGKRFTWTGNVEFFPTKETRLDLSDVNALVKDDDAHPSVPEPHDAAFAAATICGGEPETPGSDVTLPVVVYKVQPEYPPGEALKRPRFEVKVICQAVIDTDGHVRNATVMSTTNLRFNASAIRAVLRRRYIPAQRDGQPVAVYFTMRLDYR
jgi:TonB family protein